MEVYNAGSNLLDLEIELSKLRKHKKSKLQNQKHIAIILEAVEENLNEASPGNLSVSNYMISFLSLLDQALDAETKEIKDLQMATSSMYLLDITFKYASKAILSEKFIDLLAKVGPCITDEKTDAPLLKSSIGALETLLVSQDLKAWVNKENLQLNPLRGLNAILELSLDSRPKVRRRSLEAIEKILSNPPATKKNNDNDFVEHIASKKIIDYGINALKALMDNKKDKETTNLQIQLCKLFEVIAVTNQYPTDKLEKLITLLLKICKNNENDIFLISNIFQLFNKIFTNEEMDVENVLKSVISLKPSISDELLASNWCDLISKGCITLSKKDRLSFFNNELISTVQSLKKFMTSDNAKVVNRCYTALTNLLTETIQQEFLIVEDSKIDETIDLLGAECLELLSSISYSQALTHSLNLIALILNKISLKSENAKFIEILKIVGEWRSDESKASNENMAGLELVIGAFLKNLGTRKVLKILPLNLQKNSKGSGRAWLFPLVRTYTRYSELSIFINDFMPVLEVFNEKMANSPKESMEMKIFETIVDQIWQCLPSFCWLPQDLIQVFNDQFASDLCNILYTKVELRSCICHALRNIVESNLVECSDLLYREEFFPKEVQQANLKYLETTKVANMLSVLFNIFSQTHPTKRHFLLTTIECYLDIASDADISKTFNNVCTMLKQELDKRDIMKNNKEDSPAATLMDIIVTMIKHLPAESYNILFSIFNMTIKLKHQTMQKKSYRIISKLSELENGKTAIAQFIDNIEDLLVEEYPNLFTNARASRLQALKTIVELLPNDHMHFIVNIMTELVLSTRDVNEKTRELAFQILILVTDRFINNKDGIYILDFSKLPAIENDERVVIGFNNLLELVSAGMIGDSQHMVSATVTAFSCIFYEYKDQIISGEYNQQIWEIYETIELYLDSNSKEIVKSCIGFIKVVILTYPIEDCRPRVPSLIPKLLKWSNEHTGHFKSKVKHIIERLIRRFGEQYIEQHFPESDRKLFTNIRKLRNRSKRDAQKEDEEHNNNNNEEGNNDAQPQLGATKSNRFMSAYDDVLNDSDSDFDEDVQEFDEEGNKKKRQGNNNKQYIMENKGQPLDLLDSKTLAHISSSLPKKEQAKKRQQFQYDVEGRVVINGEENSSKKVEDDPLSSLPSGINAYLDAVKQGPVRGQRNKLKFKKGTRSGNNNEDDGDDDLPEDNKLNKNRQLLKNKIGKKRPQKYKSNRKL
ncbi:hypothetical protein ACO0SA_003816 [Hanseniaspora valbyensis]